MKVNRTTEQKLALAEGDEDVEMRRLKAARAAQKRPVYTMTRWGKRPLVVIPPDIRPARKARRPKKRKLTRLECLWLRQERQEEDVAAGDGE